MRTLGRPHVSHLRGYGADVRAGLAELVQVGATAGVRVHASHLWGAPADIEAAFHVAGAAGVAVSYEMYPYRRSSTILPALLLPARLAPERGISSWPGTWPRMPLTCTGCGTGAGWRREWRPTSVSSARAG